MELAVEGEEVGAAGVVVHGDVTARQPASKETITDTAHVAGSSARPAAERAEQ